MTRIILLAALAFFNSVDAAEPVAVDVLVYGGTPAGIAAALAAASDGDTVLLVEPTERIGGLVTCGLSHTDFHAREGLTGAFRDFARRVEQHYVKKYGADSQQVKDSFGGTFGEPHVNLLVFEAMLAERKSITVRKRCRLKDVTVKDQVILGAAFIGPNGEEWIAKASAFIDATYEGDLMAAAGVPFRIGREAKSEYGETLAPEKADGQLQAYNFRFIMTKDPKNRVTPVKPKGYNREDFLPVLDALKGGQIKSVFGYPRGCIFKAQTPPLPNGKYDINDVSQASVRLSLPGKNLGWPNGTPAEREKIFDEHLRDQAGLLFFLQNDDAVPEKFRLEAREWGWCKDEFERSGHLPPQLYVREARRMIGLHTYKQQDSEHDGTDARARFHEDSIAIGEYGHNCHGTAHEGPRFGGKHSGEFYGPTPPYQIPYGVIVPKTVTNLLVPGAVSASHVGFCALRLEPIWMSLGQAAGHASHLSRTLQLPVQSVTVRRKLQERLHQVKAATIYIGDVKPDDPEFAVVQLIGTMGGFHGLFGKPTGSPRGMTIHGQYSEGYPRHTVDLDTVLTAELAERWTAIAWALGRPAKKLLKADGKLTRRQWLQALARI